MILIYRSKVVLTWSCLCAGEVYDDVELVWANCRAFNEPDSDICALADEAQQAFKSKWQQQDLPEQDRPAKKKSRGKAGKQPPPNPNTTNSRNIAHEAGAAADDKASKKQKKWGGKADAQPSETAQPSRKGRAGRDSPAAQPSRRAKRATADPEDSSDADKDVQPSSSAAAKSPDRGKQKPKGAKANRPIELAQPGTKKQRLSGEASAAGDAAKQKSGRASVKQEGQQLDASEKPGMAHNNTKMFASHKGHIEQV